MPFSTNRIPRLFRALLSQVILQGCEGYRRSVVTRQVRYRGRYRANATVEKGAVVKKPCSFHGCSSLIEAGVARCEKHRGAYNRRTRPQYHSVYRTARRVRITKRLRRERGHACETCGLLENVLKKNGRGGLSVHHEPSLKDLLDQGRSPYDPETLFLLCLSCHGKREATVSRLRRR